MGQFSQGDKLSFYDHFFDRADYDVYRYDVGSYCTRRIILSQILHSRGTVLEIGTGLSTLLEDLQAFKCFGIDISPRTIATVQKLFKQKSIKADLRVADAEVLPFTSNFFDVIVSSHTFEHIQNDHAAIKECARVLKPGGELIMFVPGRVNGIATDDELLKFGHYRMYNAQRIQELEKATSNNLHITRLLYPHKIHNMIWNRMKHLCRLLNYPIKKWVFRDNRTYELRPSYKRFFLPAVAGVLDCLDKIVMYKEKKFLWIEFNVLVRFEKIK